MDDTTKVVILVALCITSISLAGIANNYYTDKNALAVGLHQQQLIGQSGYIWVR